MFPGGPNAAAPGRVNPFAILATCVPGRVALISISPAGPTRAGRIWSRAGRSCPVRSRSVMETGEAAHRSRSESGHAPGARVRAVPRGRRGTGGPGVVFEPGGRGKGSDPLVRPVPILDPP